MKPLLVLLGTFVIALFSLYFTGKGWNIPLAGRIGMAMMLLFTAIGHFTFTNGMSLMIPDFIPFKAVVVKVTGILEIVAAVSLLVPATQPVAGWLLIIFFLLILPANIKAALLSIDYQQATFTGKGPTYLWFRIPLQFFFIAWVYLTTLHPSLIDWR
ncbi:hypothetical protein [Spirosoma montaniterrae]|uniref:DoxX family protein n=1 Tax=Spirosoma montaniterrae TaxID=1178516 RepID=A0A1P9WUY1_9BACT|nr:hypothetical protein [Spirosoma montaniterrae]AQG79195.1 hypothetical protein AWR27_07575 [Spirosoma montaniterrae]